MQFGKLWPDFIKLYVDSQDTGAVTVRSKASVCGRSPSGIAGSNPAVVMDVCLLCVLCIAKVGVSATS